MCMCVCDLRLSHQHLHTRQSLQIVIFLLEKISQGWWHLLQEQAIPPPPAFLGLASSYASGSDSQGAPGFQPTAQGLTGQLILRI